MPPITDLVLGRSGVNFFTNERRSHRQGMEERNGELRLAMEP